MVRVSMVVRCSVRGVLGATDDLKHMFERIMNAAIDAVERVVE